MYFLGERTRSAPPFPLPLPFGGTEPENGRVAIKGISPRCCRHERKKAARLRVEESSRVSGSGGTIVHHGGEGGRGIVGEMRERKGPHRPKAARWH